MTASTVFVKETLRKCPSDPIQLSVSSSAGSSPTPPAPPASSPTISKCCITLDGYNYIIGKRIYVSRRLSDRDLDVYDGRDCVRIFDDWWMLTTFFQSSCKLEERFSLSTSATTLKTRLEQLTVITCLGILCKYWHEDQSNGHWFLQTKFLFFFVFFSSVYVQALLDSIWWLVGFYLVLSIFFLFSFRDVV